MFITSDLDLFAYLLYMGYAPEGFEIDDRGRVKISFEDSKAVRKDIEKFMTSKEAKLLRALKEAKDTIYRVKNHG